MNKYLKSFLQRGLAFGGFGPTVTAIVLLFVSLGADVTLDAKSFAIAVVSTYILAFVHAGASVFNQIEGWPLAKSLGMNFLVLYTVYVFTYLVNAWIPFEWAVVGIFTAIFSVSYLVIWFTVYFIVRTTAKKLNGRIAKRYSKQ